MRDNGLFNLKEGWMDCSKRFILLGINSLLHKSHSFVFLSKGVPWEECIKSVNDFSRLCFLCHGQFNSLCCSPSSVCEWIPIPPWPFDSSQLCWPQRRHKKQYTQLTAAWLWELSLLTVNKLFSRFLQLERKFTVISGLHGNKCFLSFSSLNQNLFSTYCRKYLLFRSLNYFLVWAK